MDENKDKNNRLFSIKQLISISIAVIVVVCICILFYFMIERYTGFASGFNKLFQVLQPILFGAVTAYFVNPIMKSYEKNLSKFWLPRVKKEEDLSKVKKRLRALAIAGSLATFLLIIAGLVALVLPQLILNIASLAESVPSQVHKLMLQFEDFMNNSPSSERIAQMVQQFTDYLNSFLKGTVLPKAGEYLTSITNGVVVFVKSIFNLFVGLIVAVYILTDKEKFKGQFKKVFYALMKPDTGNKVIRVLRKSNDIFSGFIIGKIIDSLIIGVIAFFVLWIMRMPYPVLLASIIGITNMIPVFGPFIGAIPCFILVLLYNPIQSIYFFIFIIVLQQVDGNIIGPNILGDATGLSSFWVIFSILIGGGFFGVAGMLIGVPVFAVIYYLFRRFIEYRLTKKELPTETTVYVGAEKIDLETHEVIQKKETEETEEQKGTKKPFWKRFRGRK